MSEFKMVPLGQLVLVAGKKGGKPDVKPLIHRALDDPGVMELVAPFISNGGITGRRSMDDMEALNVILQFDAKHGGHIAASICPATASEEERRSHLLKSEVLDAFFVVVRRFYSVKKHRVVGYNTKRVMGLSLAA
jgi:hypothetical protein